MRKFLHWLLKVLYGFRAYNLDALNIPGPVLLLPNHLSWWDWLLIGVCLENDWRFVTSSTSAETSWVHRKIMINRRTFPVDFNSPYALKRMAEYLKGGGRLVLFPEGRLSRTGSLMKLFEGTGFLLLRTHASVITAYIRNAQRLPWSPNPCVKQWFPRLTVHFSDSLLPPEEQNLKPAEARARIMDALRRQMTRQQFETEMEFGPATLPAAIAEAAERNLSAIAIQDTTLRSVSFGKLLMGAELLADQWKRLLGQEQDRVGVLLPNVNAMPATLLSLWGANKIPAVLNFSSGGEMMAICAKLAGLKHIITSKAFVERFKIDTWPFKTAKVELIFLEDVRAGISKAQKARAFIGHLFGLTADPPALDPDNTAVVLFTSGSEGNPKGVELTHRNVLANIRQMLSIIDLLETDRFFNALPLFHSFGLTIGLLLPLVRGVFTFLYLSPLHYRVVPSAFYNLDCTVFFGTNTFLAGYARRAHSYDFHNLRYLFAAGEKLQEATANLWMRKYGVRILEGYGATECSPCLAVNTSMEVRHGSAGRFLPGINYELRPVEGITDQIPDSVAVQIAAREESPAVRSKKRLITPINQEFVGRLFVRGPNVMRGYLNPEANAQFKELGGWYDTGDIVKVDGDGFVFIQGRMKRFAKVSGEMVSLTAVEDALAGAFPQYGLRFAVAVIARPDEAKGERLLAVTNEPRLAMDQVREAIRARGLNNLAVPREIKVIRELPKLGTGKINHRELQTMIE
jgi:acyl-[acyl-carrier-protein]-phospholipid O-acyltransferase/long-chain-fatty-acid--[acyl-carrier-protein] ligase